MSDQTKHPVGCCSPSVHSRFKKGKSGNPNGRPKRQDAIYTVLQRALNRQGKVQGLGQRVQMREALIRKLRELPLSGDRRALALQRCILDEAGGGDAHRYDPEETRQKVLDGFRKMGAKISIDGGGDA